MKTEKIVCHTVHTLSKDENLELEHNRTSLTAAWVQKAYFLGLRGWNSSKGEEKKLVLSPRRSGEAETKTILNMFLDQNWIFSAVI